MNQPLRDDFGVPIAKSKVRNALLAAGWKRKNSLWILEGAFDMPMTLANAWSAYLYYGNGEL